jgi:hypothetical protein
LVSITVKLTASSSRIPTSFAVYPSRWITCLSLVWSINFRELRALSHWTETVASEGIIEAAPIAFRISIVSPEAIITPTGGYYELYIVIGKHLQKGVFAVSKCDDSYLFFNQDHS